MADMILGMRMKRNACRLCGKITVKVTESLPHFLTALLLCLPEVTKAKSYISFLDFQIVSERKTYTGTSVCIHTHRVQEIITVSRFYFLLNLYIIRLLHFYLMRKAYLLKTEIGFYFPLTKMLRKN